MMETEKYEGHTKGPWRCRKISYGPNYLIKYELSGQRPDYVDEQYPMYDGNGFIAQIIPSDRDDWPNPSAEQDILLMADALLFFEEVKRLREELRLQREATNRAVDWHLDYIEGTSGSADEFLDYVEGGDEE